MGGLVAANVSGSRRIQAGACRDFLLGVQFVDGMGQIIKNGGRVMKNVTGYDLVKLMAGSFGTLGVLSEVSLKVLPMAEASAVLLINGLSDERAIAALSQALGSPFDVNGAAHIPMGFKPEAITMIRLEGFEASVSYRAGKLRHELASIGDIEIETSEARISAMWKNIRDVEAFHGKPGDVWRISVKPSDGPLVGALLRKIGASVQYDWGGGLVWALLDAGTDVRGVLAGINGHARLERGSGQATFPSQGELLDTMAAKLRAKFDPRGILNPGLMG